MVSRDTTSFYVVISNFRCILTHILQKVCLANGNQNPMTDRNGPGLCGSTEVAGALPAGGAPKGGRTAGGAPGGGAPNGGATPLGDGRGASNKLDTSPPVAEVEGSPPDSRGPAGTAGVAEVPDTVSDWKINETHEKQSAYSAYQVAGTTSSSTHIVMQRNVFFTQRSAFFMSVLSI